MLKNSNLGHVPQTKNVSCGAMARRRPDKKILGAPSLLISRTVNLGHWISPAKGCPLKLLRLVVPKGNEETPGESKCASSPQKSKMASSIQPDLLVTASHIWCQSSNPQKGNIRIMFRDTKPEEAMGHVLRVLVKSGETPKLGPPLKLGREPPPICTLIFYVVPKPTISCQNRKLNGCVFEVLSYFETATPGNRGPKMASCFHWFPFTTTPKRVPPPERLAHTSPTYL